MYTSGLPPPQTTGMCAIAQLKELLCNKENIPVGCYIRPATPPYDWNVRRCSTQGAALQQRKHSGWMYIRPATPPYDRNVRHCSTQIAALHGESGIIAEI